jgi:hypothetical protein
MTQPIPIPIARDLYDRLTVMETELLILELGAAGLAGMVAGNVLRLRQMQTVLRPIVIADGAI